MSTQHYLDYDWFYNRCDTLSRTMLLLYTSNFTLIIWWIMRCESSSESIHFSETLTTRLSRYPELCTKYEYNLCVIIEKIIHVCLDEGQGESLNRNWSVINRYSRYSQQVFMPKLCESRIGFEMRLSKSWGHNLARQVYVTQLVRFVWFHKGILFQKRSILHDKNWTLQNEQYKWPSTIAMCMLNK